MCKIRFFSLMIKIQSFYHKIALLCILYVQEHVRVCVCVFMCVGCSRNTLETVWTVCKEQKNPVYFIFLPECMRALIHMCSWLGLKKWLNDWLTDRKKLSLLLNKTWIIKVSLSVFAFKTTNRIVATITMSRNTIYNK